LNSLETPGAKLLAVLPALVADEGILDAAAKARLEQVAKARRERDEKERQAAQRDREEAQRQTPAPAAGR